MKHYLQQLIRTTAGGAYKAFLTLLSPPYCASCSILLDERVVLCLECTASIRPIVSTTLDHVNGHTVRVFAVSGYQDPLRKLILAKSHADFVAGSQLGELIWQHSSLRHVPFDVIVPVPLHWTRYAWRGYNQAEEMARTIAYMSGKPMEKLVKRARYTRFQSAVLSHQRGDNVRNVFVLNRTQATRYQGKHILLVDDLMTTGSTLKEVGREIARCKPASITAVVACRVV